MDSFTPFASNTPSHETVSSQEHCDLTPFSLKRRRSDSMHEDTTVDSISDGSLSDSSTASNKRYFVDLPAAYLAVQNLLCTSDALAADVQSQLAFIAKSRTKNEFRKAVTRYHFFKFYTDAEFDLLWKEVRSSHSSLRNTTNHLTELQISEFFERRFKEIKNVCMMDWQALTLKSSRLYIPGQMGDFHLSPTFENQMLRHTPEDIGFNQTLDFIINKVRSENWQQLVSAFSAELSYCPPLQIEKIISACSEKGFPDLILLTLTNNPYRSISMLDDISDYSSRKSDHVFIENILGLFVPWLFSLPETVLVAKMQENSPALLDKKLLAYWVHKQYGRYVRQAAVQKQNLRQQEKVYVDSEAYTQALNFFKNMLGFLQQTIIWAGNQGDEQELMDMALDCLKSNPLLTGGLQPENRALVSLAVLKNQLEARAPLSVTLDLLTSLNYFDYRTTSYETTNQIWRSFLTYWHAKRPTSQQFKDQLSALMVRFRNFSDLHNQPYKDDVEKTTFLEMFLNAFVSYPEVCNVSEYHLLLQHFLKNKFQLVYSSERECSKLSYKTLEIFLNLLAQGYAYSPADKKHEYMDYLMSQQFMSEHFGLCAVYMILTRTMIQSSGSLSSSFCRQLLVAMAEPTLLSRVPLDTVTGFLNAYEEHLVASESTATAAHEVVLNLVEQIIRKNDNPLLSNYLKSRYGLPGPQAPILFAGPRSLSPINIQVLPRSYKPGQQTRVIYHMPDSAFLKMK